MAAPPMPFMPLPFPFPAPMPQARSQQRSEGPDAPQKTLYIQNLNEKVKLDALKRDLRAAFSVYGDVIQVYCKKSVKMRGQAFVVFQEQESADKAKVELRDFPLHGKPMNIQYAKTKSDDTAKLDGTIEENKKAREERKALEKAHESSTKKPTATSDDEDGADADGDEPMNGTGAPTTKRKPTDTEPSTHKPKKSKPSNPAPNAAQFPFQNYYPGFPAGAGVPPGMPAQEFEVPNNVLFLQNLGVGVTQQMLQQVFTPYPGLKEVRMVPGKSELAFVEYSDESQAAVAKNALNGYKIGDKEMRVTFAKK
ncbi:hypothetical protein HDU93_004358 [Gonapodya sp. JEL0774]|nr:hypothetical protein HDU93_004358 [Gonapodya sp. JEL0774]